MLMSGRMSILSSNIRTPNRRGAWSLSPPKRQSTLLFRTLLGATVLFLIVSQLQVNGPAFSSRYNFFHHQAL
jgi:hypothetical protein